MNCPTVPMAVAIGKEEPLQTIEQAEQASNKESAQSGEPTVSQRKTGREARSTRADRIKILAFGMTLVLLFGVGLLFFLRPRVSEEEKRTLTEFPKLTWDSFITGEYFSQISLWYADTYPARDLFISVNQSMKEIYGIKTMQIVQNPTTDKGEQPPTDQSPTGDPATPGNENDSVPVEQFDRVFVKGNRAFEIYTFSESASDRYAAVISLAAERMEGVTVYNAIVPLSYSVNLTEREQAQIHASDIGDAIAYMYGRMSDRVQRIEILSGFLSHKSEELYFRTDHHWTARGAYYAYVAFCEASGQTALPLSTWQKYEFEGFLGSLYRSAGEPSQLKKTPDTVEAWIPNSTNEMQTFLYDSREWTDQYPIVRKNTDAYYQSAGSKYLCFIAGDHPLIKIDNPLIEDGRKIIVVKESYGNAFVPFLVDQYDEVYVVDYRFFKNATGKTLPQLAAEVEADEVLFLNYIYATAESGKLAMLEGLIG